MKIVCVCGGDGIGVDKTIHTSITNKKTIFHTFTHTYLYIHVSHVFCISAYIHSEKILITFKRNYK